jgi:DNA-binding winged helix-turn-helix (wHTH) protein/TolB-like protein/Flp pilus assembly protein TadD
MQETYEFGPFRVDPRRRTLERDGTPIALSGKAFEILVALLERRGEILDKDTLMKIVWPDTVVEENNLTVNISWLRKALGETPQAAQYILTIPGRGYRFIGEIKSAESPEAFEPRQSKSFGLIYAAVAGLTVVIALGAFFWYRHRSAAGISSAGSSIAVLPFRVLGTDPVNAYLGPGLTDALITRLANLRGLTVRPMSSVSRLADKDPFAAGRDAGVEIVLDGKVQRLEGRVRVTVQMLRVADGASLWADQFDEDLTNLFTLEDSISTRVAASLAQNLPALETNRTTRNGEAYANYLRGRYWASRYTEEGFRKSMEFLQSAIAADPGYALAYSGLADCYYDASNMLLPPREAMVKAKAAANRAAELDPTLAEAHISLGIVASKFDWDWKAAEREFQTALKLNPKLATAHMWFGLYRAGLGDSQVAISELRVAQELDPLSSDISSYLATTLYWSRKNDAALQQARKTIEYDPNYFPARITLAWILNALDKPVDAVAACRKARELADTPWTLAALARAQALAGQSEEARQALDSLRKLSAERFVSGYDIATIHAALGQRDEAFSWLENAMTQRAEWLGYLKVDPQLDDLHSDSRFRDLLRRLGL